MNRFSSVLAKLLTAALCLAVSDAAAAQSRGPVVVELFTSEGCSSCPPADALLASWNAQRYLDGIELILLSEHVDYWNYLGWKDRFSAPIFSRRQNDYAKAFHLSSSYTPQMVVDGRFQGGGYDSAAIGEFIRQAAETPKSARVAIASEPSGALQIKVTGAGMEPALVLLALVEDNLTTSVKSGENGGRTLRHEAVVRSLRQLGSTHAGEFSALVHLNPNKDWKAESLRVITVVQRPADNAIIGANSAKY